MEYKTATWHLGISDEAEPIESPEDDVLDAEELGRLAHLAEHPELGIFWVAHAKPGEGQRLAHEPIASPNSLALPRRRRTCGC